MTAVPQCSKRVSLGRPGVVVVLSSRGVVAVDASFAALDKSLIGDLLILLGVIAWAFYAVVGKPYAQRYGAMATTGTSIILGTLLYLPLGIAATDFAQVRALSGEVWLMIAYLVVVTSVISYVIYYWSLARTDASKVAIFSNLQPVMTACLAWAIYGEKLTASFAVGGVMVIAGVFLTERA